MRRYVVLFLIFISYLLVPVPSSAVTLGPYSGQVVDSRTGEPIDGASVLIYWTRTIISPAGSDESFLAISSGYTNEKGIYNVPEVSAKSGLLTSVASTNVIIYQPGYEACIVNNEFKKNQTLVKLDRIPPGFDYNSHYRKITDFLRPIDEYMDYYTGILSTGKSRTTGPIIELEEFLRRIEWEGRRDSDEDLK